LIFQLTVTLLPHLRVDTFFLTQALVKEQSWYMYAGVSNMEQDSVEKSIKQQFALREDNGSWYLIPPCTSPCLL
jgi:poly-D-alanine transfer protein DltD